MPNAVSKGPMQDLDPFAGSAFSAVERIGAGGMGEVHRVLHRELGREFVAKVVHARYATDERMLDRVRVEAQALGKLNHPNIVSVTGFGTTQDGRPFVVMEHLRGRTLAAEVAARGALPPREAISYALQLLAALEAAHGLGIIHRDIKPDNLFLAVDSEGKRVLKVLDFGLARVLPGFAEGAPLPLALPTSTGHVIGTPHFVSPEGALGKKVDGRADLYATGLVLYGLLAGRGPFDRMARAAQILSAQANTQPVAPSVLGGLPLPPALDRLVLFALRKDPNQRFQSARHFAAALMQVEQSLAHERISDTALPSSPELQAASRGTASAIPTILTFTSSKQRVLLFLAVTALSAFLAASLIRFLLEARR